MVNEVKTVRIRVPKQIWKEVSKVAIDLEVKKETLVNKAIKEWLVREVRKVEKVEKVKKVGKVEKVGKVGKVKVVK